MSAIVRAPKPPERCVLSNTSPYSVRPKTNVPAVSRGVGNFGSNVIRAPAAFKTESCLPLTQLRLFLREFSTPSARPLVPAVHDDGLCWFPVA